MEESRAAKFQILSGNQIKYILILAMIADHIGWALVPKASVQGQLLHFFGRLTGPGMAYFLAEGFRYTKNLKAYALRLGIFAFLSWPAYAYFEKGTLLKFYPCFGVIYSLFIALLILIVYERFDWPPRLREGAMILLMGLSLLGDWAGFIPTYALIFHHFREEPKKKWIAYCIVSILTFSINGFKAEGLFQTGVYLVPFLLLLYNGRRGSGHPFHKWFFYFFYPIHLFILGYFRWR
ncbi:MAG: conjugal transfer protein TraX [Lachnospiraceae bacterium]|nr:conjugal transfer protein TraX [Lachnospiraceae bacterium]